MNDKLSAKLQNLPAKPGVYLFKGENGEVLYIGKGVSLRSRVRSYFQPSANLTLKVARLVRSVHDLEFLVTESELEALVLECNLIKRYRPYFNVRLRDDKQYPYLCVTTSEPFPRMIVTRHMKSDGNRYFGPYTGTRAIYATMDLMNRIFPIVTCGKKFDGRPVQKPCLYYHLGQCLAPCAGLANGEEYRRSVNDLIAFLEGKQSRLARDLRSQMERASEELRFEQAARLRDQLSALEELMERQKVISERAVDQDVVAMVAENESACVQMFYVRGGRLVGQRHFILDGVNGESPAIAVQEFIKQFYQTATSIPSEVLLPVEIEESQIIESWLRGRRASKVELLTPKRGERKRLVDMATENAKLAIEQIMMDQRDKEARNQRSLLQLAEAIGLSNPPQRIECFDISNFQGSAPVASMVVCEGGEMAKSEYRRFKIRWHEETPDDFAMMREVITRRLGESQKDNPKFARMPDLIIVDGGKGQLSSALAAMEDLKIHLPAAGLAKQFEYLFIPDRSDPVILPRGSAELHLVQRIRDEAHRFALTYHRKIRSARQSFSKLDEVSGIGAVRRKELIRRFGSLDGLRAAMLDELASTEKMSRPAAEKLYRYLHPEDDEKKERAS